jgi:hypothetical protein
MTSTAALAGVPAEGLMGVLELMEAMQDLVDLMVRGMK